MSSSVALAEAPDNAAAPPLSVRMAAAIAATRESDISAAAREKLRICLIDFLACAFEAHALPWARQARRWPPPEPVPARSSGRAQGACGRRRLRQCVAGHGLVREDMHTGSVSHLGIVVLPPLLALARAAARGWAELRRRGDRRIRGRRPDRPGDRHA